MKVLFVSRHTGSRTFPLASASLAASLESRFDDDVDCRIREYPPGFDIPVAARQILDEETDVLALSISSWSRDDLLALAAAVREGSEPGGAGPVIIAGGPEPSGEASSAAAGPEHGGESARAVGGPQMSGRPGIIGNPAIDLVVSGEGEDAIVGILAGLMDPLSEGPPRGLHRAGIISDIDSLPSPWKARDIAGREWDDYVWELGRGCPFACHFCFESRGSRRLRHKSLSPIAGELEELKARGARTVFVLDPTFNANPRRAADLLRLFLEEAPDIAWHMEIRTEFLDEEQAALFAELGCTLQIGLQTADEAVAAGIGRPFSAGEFRDRILLLHEYGVVYGLDLIWGLPGDSLEGFRRSLDFALSCAPNHLDMFPLSVLPGTRLRAEAAGRGLPHLPEPPYTVTGTTSFPAGDLEAAAVLAGQVEFFYNECRAVPWFLILCEALDLGPVRLMERAGDLAGDGRPPQKNRPEWLQGLVRDLAASAGKVESAELLGDLVAVLTLESAARQGLEIPEVLRFTFRPDILLGHLEMGISDLDELAAFVPREPGKFGISTDDGAPVFRERRT